MADKSQNSERTQHPAFPQPDILETTIWRYMDFPKFAWLISERRLYMSQAMALGDPLEGVPPGGTRHWWNSLVARATTDEKRTIAARNQQFMMTWAEAFRTNCFVSCWHMNDSENNRMWETYTKTNDAVAVKSTCTRLQYSLPDYVYCGLVRYIDASADELPTFNLFEAVMHKDLPYKFESEYRAVAIRPMVKELGDRHFNENLFEANGGSLVFAPRIDLDKLIEGIILHPECSQESRAKIASLCQSVNLIPPIPSSLRAP